MACKPLIHNYIYFRTLEVGLDKAREERRAWEMSRGYSPVRDHYSPRRAPRVQTRRYHAPVGLDQRWRIRCRCVRHAAAAVGMSRRHPNIKQRQCSGTRGGSEAEALAGMLAKQTGERSVRRSVGTVIVARRGAVVLPRASDAVASSGLKCWRWRRFWHHLRNRRRRRSHCGRERGGYKKTLVHRITRAPGDAS